MKIVQNRIVIKTTMLSLLSLLLLCAGACCFNKSNIKPDATLVAHINSSIESWLDVRMDVDSWALFRAKTASWRTAESIASLITNLKFDMAAVSPAARYWELTSKLIDIKNSELYQIKPISDGQFLAVIKSAMVDYKFLE